MIVQHLSVGGPSHECTTLWLGQTDFVDARLSGSPCRTQLDTVQLVPGDSVSVGAVWRGAKLTSRLATLLQGREPDLETWLRAYEMARGERP